MDLSFISLLNAYAASAEREEATSRQREWRGSQAPELYRRVMEGQGRFRTKDLMPLVHKTKSAVNSCMRYQLVPLGYVKAHVAYEGRIKIKEYEWVGK